jgi:hypothetical protein
MWARNPGGLIGVPTGEISGFSVLDVDLAKGGDAWWSANTGRLARTRMHEARSGGVHVLFQHRAEIRNSAGRIARGIDTRGEGGYVIYWPATGLGVLNPDDLAPWPDWLVPPEAPEPATSPTSKWNGSLDAKVRGVMRYLETAQEGERNAVLFWASCRLGEMLREGRLVHGTDWCRSLLLCGARRAGLPEGEAARTIASGLRTSGAANG